MTRSQKKILPLMQFVPALTPRYAPPLHLADLVSVFTRIAEGEEVQTVVDCPPRHAKTDTMAHGIVWLLKQRPSLRVCYVSHGARIAEKKSRRMLALAERARVPLDPNAQAIADWRTGVEEGGLFATSPGGAIVGEGFDLIVLDDVVRDRVTAESQLARDRLFEWFTNDVSTRLEPGGSVIECMHRWHVDDLSGRLLATGWETVHLPAIDDQGRALWPERFPIEKLQARRAAIGEYAFTSLYLGAPQPRGGMLFRDVVSYDALPADLRIVIGIDLAYTAKTRADYSVAVVLGVHGADAYVLHVERAQVLASAFRDRLLVLRDRYPAAPMVSYVGGQERTILDLFGEKGLRIEARTAVADKFIRAQPTSAAWNAGRIFVPSSAPWLDAFVSEVCGFTGKGDRNDDQIDALAAAFDAGREVQAASFQAPAPPMLPPIAAGFDGIVMPSVVIGPRGVTYRSPAAAAQAIVDHELHRWATGNASPNDHATQFGVVVPRRDDGFGDF